MTATLSGFCGITNPMESHDRCAKADCPCIHHRMTAAPAGDPLAGVVDAVDRLGKALPGLMAECTDPEGTDLAELFVTMLEARKALQALERDTEVACAKAMLDDVAETATLRVERRRGAERKAWDHESWQRDVRNKALQARGLKGAQGVLTADGELLEVGVLHEVLRAVQDAHGAGAPKTTTLKALGLDVRDYCESSPGAWTVRVTRMADETEQEGAA